MEVIKAYSTTKITQMIEMFRQITVQEQIGKENRVILNSR